jgi:hypothetical protein
MTITEDVQWVLPFQQLLHEVRDDMAHREPDVAAENLHIAECSSFTDADAVEGPHNREGKPVLLMRGAREVFDCELLEAV